MRPLEVRSRRWQPAPSGEPNVKVSPANITMPRIRTIKPVFWSHPVISKLPDASRLMALAILNYADDHGYFLADARAVRSFARPFDDDSTISRAALDDLSRVGRRAAQAADGIGHMVAPKEAARIRASDPDAVERMLKHAMVIDPKRHKHS